MCFVHGNVTSKNVEYENMKIKMKDKFNGLEDTALKAPSAAIFPVIIRKNATDTALAPEKPELFIWFAISNYILLGLVGVL